MIKTLNGWRRVYRHQRLRQKIMATKAPIEFSCRTCNQCECGSWETVSIENTPLCRGCGRPKINYRKQQYGLSHMYLCPKFVGKMQWSEDLND